MAMKMPFGVSRKKNVKASNGRVEPIQENLFGRRSTLGLKRPSNVLRTSELMPSAPITRSASHESVSISVMSRWYSISTPSDCARRLRIFSSDAREQPQNPLPPTRCSVPRK